MATDPWNALPTFLSQLTDGLAPAEVIQALTDGPLDGYTANSGVLWKLDGDDLVLIATVGYEDGDFTGFERMSVNEDLPICQAVRHCTPVVTGGDEAEDTYEVLHEESERWRVVRDRMDIGTLVSVPALSRGLPVGAFYFTCEVSNQWSATDIALLEGLGSAIALWLGGRTDAPDVDAHTDGSRLTDRQLAILRLVAAGRTTSSIAAALGYSTSTVKQEVRRVVHQLDAHDRNDAAHKAAQLGLIPTETP